MYPSVSSDTAYKIIDKEGDRRYELANHLGNVLAVISDRKLGISNGNAPNYISFEAITISATDYYPFGMSMPGRSFTAANTEGYRYSFNGKEDDTEWAKQDFGARMYDKRLGRWLSIDPLQVKYPNISAYTAFVNSPIYFIDPDGKEVIAPNQASKDLILKTVSYMFGKSHGYSFDGDKLTHGATAPSGLSAGQTSMYNMFNGGLVDSKTKTKVRANESIGTTDGGNLMFVKDKAAATTFYEGASIKILGEEKTMTLKFPIPANQTILVPASSVKDGTGLAFADGTNKNVGVEHILSHEFGHGIVNVIMNEMGGVFNGTDFNKMTEQERSDWSIRFTNTLMKSQGKTQENGEGQHDKKASERSKDSLKPINE